MTTAIHRLVDQCRGGTLDRAVCRVDSGWVVMGESQRLPGYCLLLPDPVVGSLNDLGAGARRAYLEDMARLGDAVNAACSPRRINYEILGNLEPALHAHVLPRYESEPAEYRTGAVWAYPPALWDAPEHRFNPARHDHSRLLEMIRAGLAGAPAPQRGLFGRACAFAARAHEGQRRKDGRTPYIAHPVRVAMIVRDEFGCDDHDALAAAVLHDTIEDTRADYDDLLESFGRPVADLAAVLTKDMRLVEPVRERAYDEALSRADWRARLIKLADTLDNWRDTTSHPSADVDRMRDRCRRAVALARPLAGTHPALARAVALVERESGLQG